MDPHQSIQPDPPDDDPDQDADQPPPYPSPALLDSALSLVAQPLASAAARVAASHPIAFPLEDLNDFNVDLSWAAPEIDSAFLNDTEYVQLGDDLQPSPLPHPSLTPQPLPSISTSATAAIPPSVPDSQPLPPVSLSAQTFPSESTPQNDLTPFPASRSSSLPRKPSRQRLSQPNIKPNPIPIAPRSLAVTKLAVDRTSASPAPRSMQAQSSLRDAPKPVSTPPRQASDPATAPAPAPVHASHKKDPTQSPPTSFTRFPLGMSPHPMIPIMNMYPLQQHQSMFHPSQSARSPHDLKAQDSRPIHRPPVSQATDSTKVPPATAESAPALSPHPGPPQHAPQQPFLTPPVPVMPQGMVPYDTNIMPFFQMAYAAAAAGYPHGVVPPLPARPPNMPPPMLNPYGSDRSIGLNPNNNQSNLAQPPGTGILDQATQQAGVVNEKSSDGPVVVQKSGKQVFVPQQKAARLERHPVLGRLQLKSASKPQVATSTGLESNYVVESNVSVREDQLKRCVAPTYMVASSTNVEPPPVNSSSVTPGEVARRQQKKRLVWTQELHERFVKAISAVGLNNSVPKTIVTIMNVEGLTTEHVKSHLQKYRNSMRKEAAEEERDRGSGPGPTRDLRHQRFGTPATGATPGSRTATLIPAPGDANRSSQVRAVATNPIRHQTLSFLPSRMNALGGQMREILQPRVSTGLAKGTSNSVSTPKYGANSARQTSRTHSRSPSREGRACHKARSSEATPLATAKQQNAAANENQDRRHDDTMKDRGREDPTGKAAIAEDINTAENIDTTEGVIPIQNAASVGNDRSDGQGFPTASVMGDTEQAQRIAACKEATTAAANISPIPNNRDGMKAQADDRQKNVMSVTKANARVDNVPSASQSNRDSELELMKEETQQMQLQVQMMVYRTIALEKKLEEVQSGRLNAEVSSRVDSSKRSTGGDAIPEVARAEGSKIQEGDETYKSAGAESAEQTGTVTTAEEQKKAGEGSNHEQLEVRSKKRPRPFTSEGKTEVEALLGAQMGLQKRLENASALIDKRMKTDGNQDFVNHNKNDQEWEDASLMTGKDEDNDENKNKGRGDPKVVSGQKRNG